MRSLYDAIGISRLDGSENFTGGSQGPSIPAQSLSGSTAVSGAYFDTKGFQTAVLRANAQAASGTPTTATVVFKLQESASTTGSTFVDAKDNSGTLISGTVNVTGAAGDVLARIEGLGLNRKRYLRIVATPAFTGGTTPATLAFAEIIASRAFLQPVQSDVSNT
jgi:hypothetical protein